MNKGIDDVADSFNELTKHWNNPNTPVNSLDIPEINAPKVGVDWFDDVARQATRNPGSDKLVLGHFSQDTISYQKVAAHYKATYFKLDDWKSVTKGMSQDEIWRINKVFLTQQIRKGKQILFSHDPLKARPKSFFEREVNFLRDLGYSFKQKNQWTWEAVR